MGTRRRKSASQKTPAQKAGKSSGNTQKGTGSAEPEDMLNNLIPLDEFFTDEECNPFQEEQENNQSNQGGESSWH